MSDGNLLIDDSLLDDLLSALRRHDRGDSERLLQRWYGEPIDAIDPDDDDDVFMMDLARVADVATSLSAWVHREASLHVAAGRFEYALCLIENNRRPFVPQDLAARNPTEPR